MRRIFGLSLALAVVACGELPSEPDLLTVEPDFNTHASGTAGDSDIVIDDFVYGTGEWVACGSPVFDLHEDPSIAGGARELALRDRGSCYWGPARIGIDAAQGTAHWYGGSWRQAYAAQQVFAYGTEIGTLDRRSLGTGYSGSDDPYQNRINTPLNLSLTLDDQILIEVVGINADGRPVGVRIRDGQGRTFEANMALSVGTNLLPLSAFTGLDEAAAADIDGILFSAYGSFNDFTGVVFDKVAIRPGAPADDTPPVITAHVTGTEGENGWYVSDVDLTWTVTDAESEVTTAGCDAVTVDYDTQGESFTCSATSDGGSASETVTIMRDATPPTVTFSGSTEYTVDQTVDITCSASDATSGVATDCADAGASGDAYTFGVGTHTLNATATDNAGNEGTGSATFTVLVTAESLCALTQRWVSKRGVANAMCKQLQNNAIRAYINHVRAQTGKSVSAEHAAILIELAGAL